MEFKFKKLEVPDVVLVEHQSIGDERGFFSETFREDVFAAQGIKGPFVQENHSRSAKGVLRGLHFQKAPHAHGKLVRCARGEVFDVAVDVRKGSPTYRKWVGVTLSEKAKNLLWIPPGFAHGFMVLSDEADVVYRQTDYYSPEDDRGIRFDDPAVGVHWPLGKRIVSDKDQRLPLLKSAENEF